MALQWIHLWLLISITNHVIIKMLRMLIHTAKAMKVKEGICRQGSYSFPEISISVTPDSVVTLIVYIKKSLNE